MLDGEKFAGAAARELKEETGIEIKESELIDLIGLSYKGKFKGMCKKLFFYFFFEIFFIILKRSFSWSL